MRKIVSSLVILILIVQFTNCRAQGRSKFDKDAYVFWFFIKAELKKDRVLKRPIYMVRRASKEIKSGTIRKYEKEVYKNINNGNQLAVGPFEQLEDATRANEMYNLARKTDEQMEKIIDETSDTLGENFFWYTLQFKVSDRTRKYLIVRQPARIAQYRTLKEFRFFLWSSLKSKQLAIGPFVSQMEAEESKRLYRLEDAF